MNRQKVEPKYIYTGITAVIVIFVSILFKHGVDNWGAVSNIIKSINKTMTPLVIGFVLAYLLNPILNFFEIKLFLPLGKKIFKGKEKTVKKFARTLSVICTQIVFIAMVSGFLWLIIPQLYRSLESIIRETPEYVNRFTIWINNFEVGNKTIDDAIVDTVMKIYEYASTFINDKILLNIDTIIVNISSGVIGFVSMLFKILVGFIVSIYVMASKDLFRAQSKKILYCTFKEKKANVILDGVTYAHKVIGGFFTGKIIDSIIIGMICFIVLSILKLDYVLLISVIVGITNIIPFFGPFIGAVPCGLFLLMIDPIQCLVFVIFIIILQQVDGNIIGPLILGDTIGISGFWVLASILVGGGLFGFLGMVFGVPVFACIYALVKVICDKRLIANDLPDSTEEYRKIVRLNTNKDEQIEDSGIEESDTGSEE